MAMRNKEARFLKAPMTGIERSTIPYSQRKIFTAKMATLIPFFVDTTIMPGDTFKLDLSIVARMLTPITPTMDDLYLDTYFFFTPYRLVWDHFKEFMGENTSGAWTQTTEYTKPKIILDSTHRDPLQDTGVNLYYATFPLGSLWDYMYGGNANRTSSYMEVDALPARAYVLIYNEWFRDENWIAPKSFPTDDSNVYFSVLNPAYGGGIFKIAKYHDLYTSLLPAPQKGTAVQVPLGEKAPVINDKDNLINLQLYNTNGTNFNPGANGVMAINTSGHPFFSSQSPTGTGYNFNLGLSTDLSNATGADINALREAFAYQKIMEKMARGGSRYWELVNSFWGVNSGSMEARFQRPEYLGGKSIPLSMLQIAQTSETSNSSPLGNLAAISHTATSDRAFTKSFSEHGCIIGLLAIRQKHSYQQGIEKQFTMFRKYDNYFPQLAHLGEQAIKTSELFNGDTSTDDIVLGFNEAWYQYRYRQDTVAGYMRSGISNSLDIWHYADYYQNAPTISEDFINETDTYVRRTLAITANETHQFLIATMIKGTATRPLPLYSIPGLIDHY